MPLPYKELTALCVGMIANGCAMTCAFPIAGFMVMDFGMVDTEKEAGFYAGNILGVYMFGRVLFSIPIGILADKIGRKPMMISSMVVIAVSSLLFGLAKSYWWALVIRFLSGGLNSSLIVAKTMLSELVADKDQPAATSAFMSTWGLSQVIGPAIGGLFARPASKFGLFRDSYFWNEYPYLLPMIFPTLAALLGLVLCIVFLPETLESKGRKSLQRTPSCVYQVAPLPTAAVVVDETKVDVDTEIESDTTAELDCCKQVPPDCEDEQEAVTPATVGEESYIHYSPDEDNDTNKMITNENSDQEEPPTGFWSLFKNKAALGIIALYSAWSFQDSLFLELFPIWALAQPEHGGLGWDSTKIGLSISVAAVFLVFIQFFGFPFALRFWGYKRSFQVGAFVVIPVYVLTPLINNLARGQAETSTWCSVIAVLCAGKSLVTLAMTCIVILTNNAVCREQRCALNGLAMTVAAVFKGLGPSVGTILFAWSITQSKSTWIDFHFTFWTLSFYLVFVAVSTLWIPKRLEKSPDS